MWVIRYLVVRDAGEIDKLWTFDWASGIEPSKADYDWILDGQYPPDLVGVKRFAFHYYDRCKGMLSFFEPVVGAYHVDWSSVQTEAVRSMRLLMACDLQERIMVQPGDKRVWTWRQKNGRYQRLV